MKKLLLCVFSFATAVISAQDYQKMIEAGTYTVYEIQAEAQDYFENVGTERGTGYKPYKRWEYQALRNMDEEGRLKSPDFLYNELERYNNYLNQNTNGQRAVQQGSWQDLGPVYWNATSGWNPGVGRVTAFAVESGNSNHIIIGAQTGGVWRTVDGGANWTVLTDGMANLSVYAVAMNPNDPTEYFWGSNGGVIFKSTDSGATWNILGDVGYGNVNKIVIDPTDTTKMYCTGGGGIFKSTDSGANWTQIHAQATIGYDVEFKPGDTNVIYATGDKFFKSTDGGQTFSVATNSAPFSSGSKMMAVSADNPNVIYVLEASGSIFGGFYKSTDSGESFVKLDHGSNNYFGYSSSADDTLGQAPRDMDIIANPSDVNEVHIAGVLTWKSTNGGESFNITSQWTKNGALNEDIGYCHADVDIMEYVGDKIYVGSDGGLFVANTPATVNSTYYTDLTTGLSIRQFYKLGISQSNPVIVSGGSQDNGTSVLKANGDWRDWLGADGMETFIDKNDNSILYGTTQYGALYKSVNGGNSYSGLAEPDGKSGNWVTPFEQDPIAANTIYVGYDEVYKSTNGGASWVSISQNFGDNLDEMEIAPSDSNVIFAYSYYEGFFKTSDGGATNWTSVTGYSGIITDIAIHPTNPDKIAISTTASGKVYVSNNGGSTWTSYLYNLPNFSARALAWDNNGNDGLYVGMNYGVYYTDNTMTTWEPFSVNLPNVEISELEINNVTDEIYAATYGRGLWKSAVYNPTLSITDLELSEVTMHPNPATDKINISFKTPSAMQVSIFDGLGKAVYRQQYKLKRETHNLDVSGLTQGVYFVRIETQNGAITKKLMMN
ncbi:MAG: T9SS type A sorting domain-containing protein [Flavobacteriaceae bacterium]|nr:T9SS type A sorting domain-containing protein [Flavobacteriaceae bacterium]